MRRIVLLVACLLAGAMLRAAPDPLPFDKGAAGLWQQLLALQTTASVMHTTAHPDDEHGGVLALLSRGRGARVSLLTLTRGESGDNAIGPELFDAVGLIRTEELLAADRYYGVDAQYFTTAIDYGFSKRLDEALEKWGRENVLREIVRIIRIDRPFVLVSRFQGNERDGHGNHQAAGLLTQEAYRIAGDPAAFPDQLRDGVRPWQPLKLYMGGVRENEDWTLRVDAGEYSPWLGDSYANVARAGLAFQRSQNGGQVDRIAGPSYTYYRRLASRVTAPEKENAFFDGIDTRLEAIAATLGRPQQPSSGSLAAVAAEIKKAVAGFSMQDPSACVPSLERGLLLTRAGIEKLASDADLVAILKTKERQLEAAISTALGIDFMAVASTPQPVVPGQEFDVALQLTNRGSMPIDLARLSVNDSGTAADPASRPPNQTERRTVRVKAGGALTRPYFSRSSLNESRYTTAAGAAPYEPWRSPPFLATATYIVDGVPVHVHTPVVRREPQTPYGSVAHELAIVPALAVNVSPRTAIVPLSARDKRVNVTVEIVNNITPPADGSGPRGAVALRLPAGWSSSPERVEFAFSRSGERRAFTFAVNAQSAGAQEYHVDAVATLDGRQYTEGYDVIEHRDLETRYLYHAARIDVRGVDVAIAPNLKVGYVMGIGDAVPAGIAQLGAAVTLLGEADLARGDLRQYDAIVTGTRAYAVRGDLEIYNGRLLDYVKDGGNLIVLYNTQELAPNELAPYPGVLTARAEEVSEEDSPVAILAPAHQVFNTPNRITPKDFDGWVEQRGSKFWSEWDAAYTPMIETHDTGQAPQRGGWLTATYGKGHYTYFAYALHRQLPYGVPGAYRLLANLLSLGKG